jgi:hypothetical protein
VFQDASRCYKLFQDVYSYMSRNVSRCLKVFVSFCICRCWCRAAFLFLKQPGRRRGWGGQGNYFLRMSLPIVETVCTSSDIRCITVPSAHSHTPTVHAKLTMGRGYSDTTYVRGCANSFHYRQAHSENLSSQNELAYSGNCLHIL